MSGPLDWIRAIRRLPPFAQLSIRRWESQHIRNRISSSGLRIPIESFADWIVYREIFDERVYDAAIEKVIGRFPSGISLPIVDLGANVGYFMLRVLDLARKNRQNVDLLDLVAIEGDPSTCAILRARIDAQPFAVRPSVYEGWVGAQNAVVRVIRDQNHFATRLADDTAAGVISRCADLEALLVTKSRIGLLKCDIEGAEDRFVESYPSILGRTDAICIEFHSPSKRDKCLDLLGRIGFVERTCLHSAGVPESRTTLYWLQRNVHE